MHFGALLTLAALGAGQARIHAEEPVLVETGGGLAGNNLAAGKTAFAKDEIGAAPHAIAKVNDGRYGNANSWIAGTQDSFVGINLGASPVTVSRVAFGRDNPGNFGDRVEGTYTLQFTSTPNPDAATPAGAWTTIGTLVYPGTLTSPALRHRYSFTPVQATGFRIRVLTTAFPIAIDELELYDYEPAPGIAVEQPTATPLLPTTASILFGSETLNTPGSPKTFTLRSAGTLALAITNAATVGGAAADFIVDTAGMATTVAPGGSTTFTVAFNPGTLTSPALRHRFLFPAVAATGIRIKTFTTSFEIGIDELELYDAPIAVGEDYMERLDTTRVAKVLQTVLLANDTDAEGDSLFLTAVANPLPAGATVQLAGNFVVYTAPAGNSGNGSFTYTVDDGAGHTATGTVTVTEVSAPTAGASPPGAISANASGADIVVTFIGVPGRGYRVQYTTSLGSPYTWEEFSPAAAITAPAGGVFSHTDVAPGGGARFYRAIPNP